MNIDGPLYFGSADFGSTFRLKPGLRNAPERKGFVGCVKDLRIDGTKLDLQVVHYVTKIGRLMSPAHCAVILFQSDIKVCVHRLQKDVTIAKKFYREISKSTSLTFCGD